MTTPPDFSNMSYICLYCANVDTSVRFYRDALGLKIIHQSPEFTSFETGATKLAIEPGGWSKDGQKTFSENPVLIQFSARSSADVEAMTAQLETKGVRILTRCHATPYGIITNFLDPDGNKLEILCVK